jgi:hypothetical protein
VDVAADRVALPFQSEDADTRRGAFEVLQQLIDANRDWAVVAHEATSLFDGSSLDRGAGLGDG